MLNKLAGTLAGLLMALGYTAIFALIAYFNLLASPWLYLINVFTHVLARSILLGALLLDTALNLGMQFLQSLTLNPINLIINAFRFVFQTLPRVLWNASKGIAKHIIGFIVDIATLTGAFVKNIAASILLPPVVLAASLIQGITLGFKIGIKDLMQLPTLIRSARNQARNNARGRVNQIEGGHRFIYNNLPVAEASAAHKANNDVINAINTLPHNIEPINSLQIQNEVLSDIENIHPGNANLTRYKEINENLYCSISLNHFNHLECPLTIEYLDNNRWHSQVYECSYLTRWVLQNVGIYATLPENRINLSRRGPWTEKTMEGAPAYLQSADGSMKIYKGIKPEVASELSALSKELHKLTSKSMTEENLKHEPIKGQSNDEPAFTFSNAKIGS